VETSFFPVFDSALEVIRQQVDAYLLKPADIRDLVTLLRKGLTEHRGTHVPLPRRRVFEVLQGQISEVISRWIAAMRRIDGKPWSKLTDDQLVDDLPVVLEELCYRAAKPESEIRKPSL
jgi:hypothetical protein